MRVELKTAGIFACGSFLIVGLGGYMATMNAMHSLSYGVAASIVMAIIGHRIAYILMHPKGRRRNKNRQQPATTSVATSPSGNAAALTGEETFLEDLGS